MEKIILADNTEIQITDGASLGNISTEASDWAAAGALVEKLTAENLKRVQFISGEYVSGEYADMTLITPVKVAPGTPALLTFGIRERTEEEIQQADVQTAIEYLPDEQALTVKNLYPTFAELIGKTVKIGTRFTHNTFLFKTIQDDILIQEQYVPGIGTESLYVQLDESHAGTQEDPIPWVPNMQPEKDKYYAEGDLIAKCIEDPGQALHNKLSELCPGRYFEAVE